jgi:hypothetical protein
MNPIRNETSLILVVAVTFSAIAIPALSGFLEPSQPPAVAAVQIGDPRDGDAARGDDDDAARGGGTPSRSTRAEPQPKPEPKTRESRPAGAAQARRPAQRPAAPPPSLPAPPDDAADDDGGEAD